MSLLFALIVLFLTILFAILVIYILIVLLKTKVPFVRTPERVINQVLQEITIKPTDTVYDLGCGNARFLITVEKKTGARTIGYEISPWAYFLSQVNIRLRKAKTIVHYKNFYKADLSTANVVFCFLINSVMPKVGKQLERQLQPGSTVICFGFAIKAWQPAKIILTKPDNPRSSKIYIYQR